MINKAKILGLIFFLNLTIYLLLKVINEVSNNSIEHLGNINLLLGLVILAGVIYYLFLYIEVKYAKKKDKDILTDKSFEIKLSKYDKLIISVFAGLIIGSIVYYKTLVWGNPLLTSLFSFFLVFYTIFLSLNTSNS